MQNIRSALKILQNCSNDKTQVKFTILGRLLIIMYMEGKIIKPYKKYRKLRRMYRGL